MSVLRDRYQREILKTIIGHECFANLKQNSTKVAWPKKMCFTGHLGRQEKENGCCKIVQKRQGTGIFWQICDQNTFSMPDDSDHSLPSPWKEFLAELDALLTEPVELHCIGGFVVCFFYGLPRSTGDIDYYTAIPADVNLVEKFRPLPMAGVPS